MFWFRLVTVALSACAVMAAATSFAPPVSAAAPHVGPNQYFTAAVNGSTGETAPVVIKMVCLGPLQPGETGHPLAGQTVAVREVFPPSGGTTALGYTGARATSIGVFFGAPPPTAATPTYINLGRYRTKAIPTTLVLPCGGTGQASFVPLPLDPSERSIAVPVTFANITV